MAKSLKEILGDDIYNQVLTKVGDMEVIVLEKGQKALIHKENEQAVVINNGSYVPKQKMDDLLEDKKQLKANLDNTTIELEKIKNSSGDVTALKSQVTTLQQQVTASQQDFDKRVLEVKKISAVKELLTKNNARYVDLLVGKVDMAKVELDDNGSIKEPDKLIEPLKTEYKEMFGVTKYVSSTTTKDGKTITKPDNYVSKKEFLAMTDDDKKKNITVINQSSPLWVEEAD